MRNDYLPILIFTGLFIAGCQNRSIDPVVKSADATKLNDFEYLTAANVKWTPLNAARGDQSPQAADLWGDRNQDNATGFLVKFADGFSSPPHIHNVTYRGVVLDGLVHNDDPDSAFMWMPAGSFWTQPAGENHITAAKGQNNVAYIEIDSGPYLVRPSDQKFATPERPINVDASNLVWVEQPDGTDLAYLWGNPQGDQPAAVFLRLPAGFKGFIRTPNAPFRAIVVRGQVALITSKSETDGEVLLASGSYFGATGLAVLPIKATTSMKTIIYVRSSGAFEVVAQ